MSDVTKGVGSPLYSNEGPPYPLNRGQSSGSNHLPEKDSAGIGEDSAGSSSLVSMSTNSEVQSKVIPNDVMSAEVGEKPNSATSTFKIPYSTSTADNLPPPFNPLYLNGDYPIPHSQRMEIPPGNSRSGSVMWHPSLSPMWVQNNPIAYNFPTMYGVDLGSGAFSVVTPPTSVPSSEPLRNSPLFAQSMPMTAPPMPHMPIFTPHMTLMGNYVPVPGQGSVIPVDSYSSFQPQNQQFSLPALSSPIGSDVNIYGEFNNINSSARSSGDSTSHSTQKRVSKKPRKKKKSDTLTPAPPAAKSTRTGYAASVHHTPELVPTNSNNIVFQSRERALTVHNFGTVVYDRPKYHTLRHIFPVGYKCTHIFKGHSYVCEIMDGGARPKFKVTSETDPSNPIITKSMYSAWVQAVERNHGQDHGKLQGDRGFGLSQHANAPIMQLIEELPNASKCSRYQKPDRKNVFVCVCCKTIVGKNWFYLGHCKLLCPSCFLDTKGEESRPTIEYTEKCVDCGNTDASAYVSYSQTPPVWRCWPCLHVDKFRTADLEYGMDAKTCSRCWRTTSGKWYIDPTEQNEWICNACYKKYKRSETLLRKDRMCYYCGCDSSTQWIKSEEDYGWQCQSCYDKRRKQKSKIVTLN